MIKIFVPFLLIVTTVCGFAAESIPIPSQSELAADLIGRKLSEGMDNGYFALDWYWAIEEGEIIDLEILNQNATDDYCSYVVLLTLRKASCPTKYKATVQMDYSWLNKKWRLILVKSMGVNIVRTDKYMDCINATINRIDRLEIRNNVDSPLIVGGVCRNRDSQEMRKFSTIVRGMEKVEVFSRVGCVDGFEIHFVEPY